MLFKPINSLLFHLLAIMQRNFQHRAPKLEGRGVLEQIETDGPKSDWLGMPDYYIHTLTVEGEQYKYLSSDKQLSVAMGDHIVFRYKEYNKEKRIDKRSLGIYIDPAEYMKNNLPS
ncbi:hypothetical protein CI610_01494 [invertebrate metagenome]|uniref:Uncharacterized protein n=1 Tax=invertebrate metagenome TaxID=1711999 RepID=A0A2H9T8M9_9ZZZZ